MPTRSTTAAKRLRSTTRIVATADTQVDESSPNTNDGADTKAGIHGKTVRTLVMFDPAAVARLTTNTAKVEVTIAGSAASNWGDKGRSVGIFRLTSPWTELGATVNCAVDTNTSNNAADCTGATAWDMRLSGSPHPWEPATSTTTIVKGQTGVVSFDVSADIARFRAGTPFYGWLLMKDIGESGNAGDVDFSTRETSTPPTLVLTCDDDSGSCEASDAGDASASDAASTDASSSGGGADAGMEGASPDAGPACTPASCTDDNPCTTDSCTANGCTHSAAADGTACGTNACDPQHCQSGTCVAGTPVFCSPVDPCHLVGACDPSTGTCSNPPAPAGTVCGGNACVGASLCDGSGHCVAGLPPNVDDLNPCTIDACDPILGVTHTPAPAGQSCPNGNLCDGAEVCDGNGACVAGTPPQVSDDNPCTDDSCDPIAGVVHTPRPAGDVVCSDSNACNGLESCDGNGACAPGAPPVIDDGNVCTLDSCSPLTGPFHTPIAGCDPTPTGADERFETRASLIGQLVDRAGAPVSGASFTVYDERKVGTPRSDVTVVQGNDGVFRIRLTSFPESEPDRSPIHRLVLVIDAPGRLTAQRVVFAHPGDAVPLGRIRLISADPAITNIGPAGGTASDSRNRIQVVIPPGALTTTIPVQITPFDDREDFPNPLPPSTITNYGMELQPSGTIFAQPVTVRVANTLNMPTSFVIPVGTYNDVEGHWDSVGQAQWDGSRFAYQALHFSSADMNPSPLFDLVETTTNANTPNQSDGKCGFGSSWRTGGGSMAETFPLPSVHAGGEDFGIALQYDSGLAGSRKLGTPPQQNTSSSTAVPAGSLAVSVGSSKATFTCVERGSGAGGGGGANTPGSCSTSSTVGTCGSGGTPMQVLASTLGLVHSSDVPTPTNATEESDGSSWVYVPFVTTTGSSSSSSSTSSSTTLARTGFISQEVRMSSKSSTTCAGGGVTFGAQDTGAVGSTVTAEAGPLVVLHRRVLMHHRFTSPYGSGWAIGAASRVYFNGDHAVLVAGSGQEEDFFPRTMLSNDGLSAMAINSAFARDPLTGESFVVSDTGGVIYRLDPTTGGRTQVVGNMGLPPVTFHGLAITYVGGQRHFVIANRLGIWDLASGAPRQLLTTNTGDGIYKRKSIAANNGFAFYTTGDDDPKRFVLFQLDLSQATPTPVAVSADVSGVQNLYPTGTLGTTSFGGLKGLAFAADGSLFMADSRRNMVYHVLPTANGITGGSTVEAVMGDGSGTSLTPVGERFAGHEFPINQPHQLAMSEDGYLFAMMPLGVVVYDPLSKEAEVLFLDGSRDEIRPSLTESGIPSFLPLTKNQLISTSDSGVVRVSVELLSSQNDPTRILTRDTAGGATLVDTSQAITDKFDSAGRLVEHHRRTGKLLYAIQYSDSDSDRIDHITNAVGGNFVFGYSNGKLSQITDPAGGITNVTVDPQGDLSQFSEPDGAIHQLVYDAHHIVKKISPRGDTTTYTYADDGTLATTMKPGGETHELHASLSNPPAYNTDGTLNVSGWYTDGRGVVHTFSQNTFGGIEKETYTADGVAYVRQADVPAILLPSQGTMNQRVNRMRRVSRWSLNGVALDRGTSFDSLGRPFAVRRDGAGQGNQDFFTYDANGWVDSIALSGGASRQIVERDANGRVTRIYEANRNFDESVDPLTPTGRQSTFTWNADDQAATITQHNVTTTFGYDQFTANLLHATDTTGRSQVFTYDLRGNVVTATDGTTSSAFTFDANNRLIQAFDAVGNLTTLGYTHASCGCTEEDLVTSIHTPDLAAGLEWSFEYGAEGRLATVTDPKGFQEAFTYEPTGEVKTVTDRLERMTAIDHDHLGRVTSLIDIAGRNHGRAYTVPTAGAWSGPTLDAGSGDGTSAGTALTSSLRSGDYQIGLNAFNTEGFPAQISLYRDATFELGYTSLFDAAARLTSWRDRTDQPITSTSLTTHGNFSSDFFTYDVRKSEPIVSSETVAESVGSFTTYNTEWDVVTQTGFGPGLESPTTHEIARDTAGRVLSMTNRFYPGSLTNFPEAVMMGPPSTYTYRPDGRVAQVVNADGTHDFAYDDRGLVHTHTLTQTVAFLPSVEGTYTYEYDAVGRNTSLTFPDGHVRTQTYDELGRIRSRCYTYPSNPSTADRCYGASYDPVGNIIQLTDPEGTDTIEVDTLDRIKAVTRGAHVESYAYNALGALSINQGAAVDHQRPRLDGGGLADAAVPATLGGQPVTLDRGGRITAIRNASFTFGSDGRFRTATAPVEGAYDFASDAQKRRAWSAPIGGAANPFEAYLYEGPNLVGVEQHQPASPPTIPQAFDFIRDQWLYDGVDHPLRLIQSGPTGNTPPVTIYYELDLAGNVRRLRGASGEDLGGYRYSAFGQTLEDTTTFVQPLRWKARPHQVFGGTEVYDMRARQWAPELGCFLSIDNYEYEDPRSTLWGWPKQSPISYSDPSGHWVGQPYASPGLAGWAAGAEYNGYSIANDRYGGLIYQVGDNFYHTPALDTFANDDHTSQPYYAIGLVPAKATIVWVWHTHANYLPNRNVRGNAMRKGKKINHPVSPQDRTMLNNLIKNGKLPSDAISVVTTSSGLITLFTSKTTDATESYFYNKDFLTNMKGDPRFRPPVFLDQNFNYWVNGRIWGTAVKSP